MGSLTALLFTYSGRINRARFWLAAAIYLATMIILLVAISPTFFDDFRVGIGDEANENLWLALIRRNIGFVLIIFAVYIPLLVSACMVAIKRLHDRDKSGWWLLAYYMLPGVLTTIADSLVDEQTDSLPSLAVTIAILIWLTAMVVSIWAFVELGFLRGTAGPNRYGPDPLAS